MTTTVSTRSAVGYFRVSSQGQAGERHVSLEVQRERFYAWCESSGLTPQSTFVDVASGRKDNRPQYQAMLRYVAEHSIGNVVVLFLDRFGRNPREILRRYWELQESGVTVQSINEDLREELMLLLRAGIAGQESKRTGERIRSAQLLARRKGKNVGRPPFGYIKIREGNQERWEQVPDEAHIIRHAFKLTTEQNMGYRALADELNRLGYHSRAGNLFQSQAVKVILANPALKGRLAFGEGEGVDGVYPAILTDDEWTLLQQRLTIRREGRHKAQTNVSRFLLSGFLKCGHCGGPMTGASNDKHSYYLCSRRRMATALCAHKAGHPKEALEKAVLEFLGQYSDPVKVRELLDAQDTVADNRQELELAKAITRLQELERAFLADLDRVDRGILNEAEYVKRQEGRRAEQTALETRKSELEAIVKREKDSLTQTRRIPVVVGTFFEDFSKMDVRQAKAELQGILKAVYVFRDKRLEVEFRG